MTTMTFFFNRGGVGKTTLTGNIGWMLAEQGYTVLLIDLDPQGSLTQWLTPDPPDIEPIAIVPQTPLRLYDSLNIFLNNGTLALPKVRTIKNNLYLVAGDERLGFVDPHEPSWSIARYMSQVIPALQTAWDLDLILIDFAPALSAITSESLCLVDWIITPIRSQFFRAETFALMGYFYRDLAMQWQRYTTEHPDLPLPAKTMRHAGYLLLQSTFWWTTSVPLNDLPQAFHRFIQGNPDAAAMTFANDPSYLGSLRDYYLLTGHAARAHKPMFSLKPADGILGAELQGAADVYLEYLRLAHRILAQCQIPWKGIILSSSPAASE